MQDRQHGAISDWIEELVAMPARRERAGLGLAVTHHDQREQVWMIVNRPVGVRDAVAEFPALVDTARGFGSCMAADPARKAELLEEALHAGKIFTLVRIDFGVRSFKVRIRQDGRRAVPRTRDAELIQIILFYHPV